MPLLTGLEPLLEKIATPQRAAKLQAMASSPGSNPYEAASARARLHEMQARPAQPQAHAGPQPGYTLNPVEEAYAQRLKGMTPDARRQALGLDVHSEMARADRNIGAAAPARPAPAAPAPAPAPAPAARPGLGRLGRGLGLGLAAVGGAGLYGALRQNADDAQRDRLVYAPMQGVTS